MPQEHRDLYDALVKYYKLDKDFFESYGKAYSLKRDREDKDKDEDPPAGSNQGLKKRKTSKDAKPSKDSKLKKIKTHEIKKSRGELGNTDETTNVMQLQWIDCSRKPERPPTPDSDWNTTKTIDFRPPQTWISKIAKAEKPPLIFDELISTSIDFLAYVMNNLKIENLTQEYLVGPAFNLLKGTYRSRVELKYHFEECYKVVTDRLYLNNPEGHEYTFNLSKPLPLIEDRGRQVVPVNSFINNDLEYLKGGSSSMKYMTSTTKTKDAKYDDIQGIEDMVPSYVSNKQSKHNVFSAKRIIVVTHVKVMKWYDYGYLEEIDVRREDQQLYKFRKVQKKLSNLERDVIFYLNVALRMSDISNMTLYTAYNNHQGIIYLDKLKRNRLMCSDELYKFCDGTLTSVRSVLHDIASSLRMD
ncbi:hypothetical protein Tco_0546413 [Tanacetum coccineum]